MPGTERVENKGSAGEKRKDKRRKKKRGKMRVRTKKV